MDEMVQLAGLVNAALKALAMRYVTILALCMTFGLFCWAMVIGSWLHFSIAGAFGVVIFLPILFSAKVG